MNVNHSLLTPIELGENPELAVLQILSTSLDVAQMALLSMYPDSCEPSRSLERRRSEAEAYALSILYQIDALSVLLQEYTESIRGSRQWRNRESSADDVAF